MVLVTGAAVTVDPDEGQYVRLTFIDPDDDIVIAEFAGAGRLTANFESFTGPAMPVKYNQAVNYVKGHAVLTLQSTDATSRLTIRAVGSANSVNLALFRQDVTYDGIADLRGIIIVAPPAPATMEFGSLNAPGARFTGSSGSVGITAERVAFKGAVAVHDVDASGAGFPVLRMGSAGTVEIAGGDLRQTNGQALWVTGLNKLEFVASSNAHGVELPRKANAATFQFTEGQPAFVVSPAVFELQAGTGAMFRIEGYGAPMPTFTLASGTLPPWASLSASVGFITGTPMSDAGSPFNFSVAVGNGIGTAATADVMVTVTPPPAEGIAPVFTQNPASTWSPAGFTQYASAVATGVPEPTYQWRHNGVEVAGATSSDLRITRFGPEHVGTYTVVATNSAGSVESDPAILGLTTTDKVIGGGLEFAGNITHAATGNTYDQLLLTGATASLTADAGQITRISFQDLDQDIVQVEFSGAGTLTITLENSAPAAPPAKYNQSGVEYVTGHASIVVAGADETTNLSVFSVGRITALNPALFRDTETYDGFADIASISITSTNGRFGGLRTANASYSNTTGWVGVYAPGVDFGGPVFVGDISASDTATPVLMVRNASDVRVTGGDLQQPNGRAVEVSGFSQIRFVDGSDSHGNIFAAQANRGRLERDGEDVTTEVVDAPLP